MSGNGWEWTRLPLGATSTSSVELRAETFKASKPFRFEYIVKEEMGHPEVGESNPEIGFRVVIELEPTS
jgi:hypothetical protein